MLTASDAHESIIHGDDNWWNVSTFSSRKTIFRQSAHVHGMARRNEFPTNLYSSQVAHPIPANPAWTSCTTTTSQRCMYYRKCSFQHRRRFCFLCYEVRHACESDGPNCRRSLQDLQYVAMGFPQTAFDVIYHMQLPQNICISSARFRRQNMVLEIHASSKGARPATVSVTRWWCSAEQLASGSVTDCSSCVCVYGRRVDIELTQGVYGLFSCSFVRCCGWAYIFIFENLNMDNGYWYRIM